MATRALRCPDVADFGAPADKWLTRPIRGPSSELLDFARATTLVCWRHGQKFQKRPTYERPPIAFGMPNPSEQTAWGRGTRPRGVFNGRNAVRVPWRTRGRSRTSRDLLASTGSRRIKRL